MSFEALRVLIIASGYEIRFRENEWVECLLLRDDEAWVGRGGDRSAALKSAVHSACPSALARELLASRVDRMDAEAAAAAADHREKVLDAIASAAPESPPSTPREFLPPPITRDFVPLPPRELPVAREYPSQEALDDIPAPTEVIAQRDVPRMAPIPSYATSSYATSYAAARSAPRTYSAPPPLVRRDAAAPRIVDPPRALEEIDILLERVRDSREELGLCSPERQRLAMLAWICEARAHTDTFPEDPRIRERVGAISRQLTEIGKTFWPGSVTALQLQMQPRDLPRHVLGGPAPTWSRAAELAERALHALEYSDERRGFDSYGWADAGLTYPAPEHPNELLETMVREIEACGGSLVPYAAPRESEARPEGELYRKWVRSLRWLRTSDVDPDRWGRVAGRLRWWATNRDVQLSGASRELDAGYMPDQSWASYLGAGDQPETNGELKANGTSVLNGLLDTVRELTSGKRLVFVSNRRDPDLELRLKDLLPEASLEWRVAESKRLETLGESIQQGAFDVVLGAIGFQSLATDHLLARACRLARVRYLRVNRGRPNACLRALARPA
jgi:hypothetical protein